MQARMLKEKNGGRWRAEDERRTREIEFPSFPFPLFNIGKTYICKIIRKGVAQTGRARKFGNFDCQKKCARNCT